MKRVAYSFFIVTILFLILGKLVQAQLTTQTPPASQSSSPPIPTPTRTFTNPFAYTPLPALNGPENDIAEIQPLTPSRITAQVDDSITFTVTIQNIAPYSKTLYSLCFESTDGNFGCVFGINLTPGQTYTVNNVGSWITGGEKTVWITWSQDGMNYYQPTHASEVHLSILG